MVIRRIDPMSCAKVAGVLYALIGLIIGLFVSVFFLLAGTVARGQNAAGPVFGAIFGVGAVIMMPIFYGVMGFVVAAVTASLYNLVAGMVGGISIEFTPPVQVGQADAPR